MLYEVITYPIHTGDRLHQVMAFHRLVDVHGIHARHVKPGQPHITDNDDLKRIVHILHTFRKMFTAPLVADKRLPLLRIAGTTGHDDLDLAFIVVITMPIRSESNNRFVHIDGNPPRHHNDHRFAEAGFLPLLEMFDNILSDFLNPLLRTGQRF